MSWERLHALQILEGRSSALDLQLYMYTLMFGREVWVGDKYLDAISILITFTAMKLYYELA